VIPGGKVFVYTGMLPIAKNDDGLAAILGHEIAHNLAKHQAEKMSQMVLLEPLRWAFISLDWALGGIAISQVLGSFALDLGLMRPASRKQESEADYIGLMMMAKSCYDPMEAVHVWERMEAYNQQSVPEYLSTHPSNQNRIANMKKWLNVADKAREESGCAAIVPQIAAFRPVMKRTLDMFR
jgi:predicted Zn-dependent protease